MVRILVAVVSACCAEFYLVVVELKYKMLVVVATKTTCWTEF